MAFVDGPGTVGTSTVAGQQSHTDPGHKKEQEYSSRLIGNGDFLATPSNAHPAPHFRSRPSLMGTLGAYVRIF